MIKLKQIILLIILTLLLLVGCSPDVCDEQEEVIATLGISLYECKMRDGLRWPCEGFSKFVSPVGKCLNSELGNKICREGWVAVESLIDDNIVISETSVNQYLCAPNDGGCKIKEAEIIR